ncbi:hypothetical protein PsorP6_004636 [Peronosclerospora sorghi]|uniref:Uncharacterized protein n=1 Tax=Peronosclerospora sorghi TaxID=230839 RepID=A0ACC0VLF7_9STRA|nr:hypothetical protein PsorP6_004636 [Peronosclerospora sorghi]
MCARAKNGRTQLRFAQLEANVVGGFIVVLGMSNYLVNMLLAWLAINLQWISTSLCNIAEVLSMILRVEQSHFHRQLKNNPVENPLRCSHTRASEASTCYQMSFLVLQVALIAASQRYFDPLLPLSIYAGSHQLAHCIKTGFLVASCDIERTTDQYYSEPMDGSMKKTMYYTFQDHS